MTHSGTWNLFHLTFVASRRFDAALAQEARDRQALREAADHDAHQVSVDEARHALDEARAFVDGVERMLEA